MNSPIHKAAALLAMSAALAGCAQTSPQWEQTFGDTVRASVASQVADPAAVRNANPVTGLDGRAAQAAQVRYEQSAPAPNTADSSVFIGTVK